MPAHWILVSAQRDGSFTVTNPRNGFSKTYAAASLAMSALTRRAFLSRIGAAGALAAAAPWLPVGYAQTAGGPARAFLRRMPGRADFDRRVFGSFLEHLGRAVYTGVYQPGSARADAKGFRTDVAQRGEGAGRADRPVSGRELRLRIRLAATASGRRRSVRPCWTGPGTPPRRISSAPTSSSSGAAWWAAEPLLGMNFGTGSVEMAVAYVEYCNLDRGTRWSELRRAHGYERPHNVRYWCLGNEMDGPWQIGQLQAREYGRKARDAAKQMRVIDPDLQLIACGSSGTFMPTYLTWDREVLEECYDQVDGVSLHAYYGNTKEWSGNSTARFLAMNLDMDRHIHEIAAVCDYVQGLQKSSKRLWLSFDEWNVWYRARDAKATDGKRAAAPPLLEEVYNLEDALLVGGFINTLLRNSDRVRVGCLAQLVNVIAPLVTNDTGVLRQSTYYPYAWALRYARGRVLDLRVESETYPIKAEGLQADFARDGTGAVRRPRRDDRRRRAPGGGAGAQPRSRGRARGRARVGGRGPDAGPGLRDADRRRSEGGQHLRGSPSRGPAEARATAGRTSA